MPLEEAVGRNFDKSDTKLHDLLYNDYIVYTYKIKEFDTSVYEVIISNSIVKTSISSRMT